MPDDIQYLTVLDVISLNDQVMQLYQQSSTIRDEGLLESSVMRPMMAAYYENADLVTQAALLIAGIALGHAFVDGNKRTALAAGTIFLDLNGYVIQCESAVFGQQIEALVKHEIVLEAFIGWLLERMHPLVGT